MRDNKIVNFSQKNVTDDEMNNVILTQEDKDNIKTVADEATMMKNIPDVAPKESITEEVNVAIHPDGTQIVISDDAGVEDNATIKPYYVEEDNTEIPYDVSFMDDYFNIPETVEEIPIDRDLVIKNLESNNIPAELAESIFPLIERRRAGEEIKFKDLPDDIREVLNKSMYQDGINVTASTTEIKNMLATEMIDSIIRDAKIDKVTIDFQTSMQKAFSSTEFNKTLSKDVFVDITSKLEEVVKLSKEKDPNTAENADKALKGYKDSIVLDNFLEFVKKTPVKKFDIKKINRFINNFHMKYEKSSTAIQSIDQVLPVLEGLFGEKYTDGEIEAFLILFCRYVQNMSATDIGEHFFMSYFIHNILNFRLVMPIIDVNDLEEFPRKLYDKYMVILECIIIK